MKRRLGIHLVEHELVLAAMLKRLRKDVNLEVKAVRCTRKVVLRSQTIRYY